MQVTLELEQCMLDKSHLSGVAVDMQEEAETVYI